MSRNSHRKRKKRKPRHVRFFSREFFARALDMGDRHGGFDYMAGTFVRPAVSRPVEYRMKRDESCRHGFVEPDECFDCVLGSMDRKHLRGAWIFILALVTGAAVVSLFLWR